MVLGKILNHLELSFLSFTTGLLMAAGVAGRIQCDVFTAIGPVLRTQ